MRLGSRWLRAGLGLALVAGLLTVMPSAAGAAAAPTEHPRRFVTGWLPYWQPTSAVASVVEHAKVFDEASPFWFSATSARTVSAQGSPSALTSAVSALEASGVPVVPTVTSTLDADRFAALLSHPARRAAHVATLVDLARRYGVAGIDLDYESVNFGSSAAKDVVRAKYPLLARELEQALQRDGRLLSVTVPARRSDSDPNWWVYDYGRLGAAADRLRLMTYDYSWSGGPAGPIAPVGWVDQVVGYAASRVDPMKISIGVPAYGRDWYTGTVSGRCPSSAKAALSRSTAQMQAFAAARGIAPSWDAASASRTFTYRERYATSGGTCVARRTVWFDDARSLQAKLRLVTEHQVRGVAVWALGNETDAFWTRAAGYQAAHPVLAPVLTGASSATVSYGDRARVAGRLHVGADPVAGASVALFRRPLAGGSWVRVTSATTDARGRVDFAVAPTRHTQYRLAASRTWSTLPAGSPTSTTRVAYAVLLDAPVPARVGSHTVTLGGRVGPQLAGVTVVKQRLRDGVWVDRGSQTVAADGTFGFVLRSRSARTVTYRVVAQPGVLDSGASLPVTVTFG